MSKHSWTLLLLILIIPFHESKAGVSLRFTCSNATGAAVGIDLIILSESDSATVTLKGLQSARVLDPEYGKSIQSLSVGIPDGTYPLMLVGGVGMALGGDGLGFQLEGIANWDFQAPKVTNALTMQSGNRAYTLKLYMEDFTAEEGGQRAGTLELQTRFNRSDLPKESLSKFPNIAILQCFSSADTR